MFSIYNKAEEWELLMCNCMLLHVIKLCLQYHISCKTCAVRFFMSSIFLCAKATHVILLQERNTIQIDYALCCSNINKVYCIPHIHSSLWFFLNTKHWLHSFNNTHNHLIHLCSIEDNDNQKGGNNGVDSAYSWLWQSKMKQLLYSVIWITLK